MLRRVPRRETGGLAQREPLKLRGQRVVAFQAQRGLGDSGTAFMRRFQDAVARGEMLLWSFGREASIWQLAMKAPFKWDIGQHLNTVCNGAVLVKIGTGMEQVVASCSSCAQTALGETRRAITAAIDRSHKNATWSFLYQPNAEVQQTVDSVLAYVGRDEVLVGVHYRSQFVGVHHSCGCLDIQELARCAANVDGIMQSRGVLDGSKELKYFVASDATAGIAAFKRVLGDQGTM